MSTFLDDIFRPLTRDLMGSLGKAITYTRYPAETDEAVSAIIEEYKGLEFATGVVQVGDKKVSVAGASFSTPPALNDTVTIDGTAYNILAVNAVYSGELVALYVLQCRNG